MMGILAGGGKKKDLPVKYFNLRNVFVSKLYNAGTSQFLKRKNTVGDRLGSNIYQVGGFFSFFFFFDGWLIMGRPSPIYIR